MTTIITTTMMKTIIEDNPTFQNMETVSYIVIIIVIIKCLFIIIP